tara:strand:+ start:717 stop:2012 length:1296 start_codon:yes stop_codon:yes gene_type:complete
MCGSQGSSDNWYLQYGGFSSSISNQKGRVAIGGAGYDVYLLSEGSGSNYAAQFFINKFDVDGTLIWQKEFGSAGVDTANGISVDSNNRVYVCGHRTGFNPGGGGIFVAKYDAGGSPVYESFFGSSTSGQDKGYAIDARNQATYSYVAGALAGQSPNGNDYFSVVQLDANGSVQWNRVLSTAYQDSAALGIFNRTDQGHIYVTGVSSTKIIVAKYNTSGVLNWQKEFNGFNPSQGNDIYVDGNNNVYVAGTIIDNSTNAAALIKLNSNGGLVWQRVLTGAQDDFANAVTVDGDGNIYLCGTTESVSPNGKSNMLFAKYNSSGVIQWQRAFGTLGTSQGQSGFGVDVDFLGNVYFSGQNNYPYINALLVKPATNGSGTGVYSDFSYFNSALTEKAGSMSISTATHQTYSESVSMSTQSTARSTPTLSTSLVPM